MPIEKRGNVYFAYLDVPADVRQALSRRVWRETLKTERRSEAIRRAGPVIAGWKAEVARARGNSNHDDATFWRQRLLRAKTPEARTLVIEAIEMAAVDIGAVEVEIGEAPMSAPAAQQFFARATGQVVGMTEHLQEWLDGVRDTPKTKAIKNSDVKRFAERFKSISDANRPDVQRWVASLINEHGLAVKTAHRILSALRGYWRFLKSLNLTQADPFIGLEVARLSERESKKAERKPFAPEHVVKLWRAAAAEGHHDLADLIELDMWTGCRREELCSLRVEKVDPKFQFFDVEDSKTSAGWRRVPVHPKLAPTMKRLCAGSKDGYVLTQLSKNKYGDRGNVLGNQFGRLKTRAGFSAVFVFHSVRRTVATMLERNGTPENVAADLLGHEKNATLSYGLYSGGTSFEQRRRAINKLRYPGIT